MICGWFYSIFVGIMTCIVSLQENNYILCYVYLLGTFYTCLMSCIIYIYIYVYIVHPTTMSLIYTAKQMILVHLLCAASIIWLSLHFAQTQIVDGQYVVSFLQLQHTVQQCIPMSLLVLSSKICEVIIVKKVISSYLYIYREMN